MANKENDQGLCFRCEYRAKFLEYGNGPRNECKSPEISVCGCYMFLPVQPILIRKREGELRPMTLNYFSGRVERINVPELTLQHNVTEDGIIVYWTPKEKSND